MQRVISATKKRTNSYVKWREFIVWMSVADHLRWAARIVDARAWYGEDPPTWIHVYSETSEELFYGRKQHIDVHVHRDRREGFQVVIMDEACTNIMRLDTLAQVIQLVERCDWPKNSDFYREDDPLVFDTDESTVTADWVCDTSDHDGLERALERGSEVRARYGDRYRKGDLIAKGTTVDEYILSLRTFKTVWIEHKNVDARALFEARRATHYVYDMDPLAELFESKAIIKA